MHILCDQREETGMEKATGVWMDREGKSELWMKLLQVQLAKQMVSWQHEENPIALLPFSLFIFKVSLWLNI